MENKEMSEDQTTKTIEHIINVRKYMSFTRDELIDRSVKHDQSKLESPEKEIFDEYTPKLSQVTYGSDEYKGYLKEMKIALDHHYLANRHHPEHFENGVNDMNLIDLIEMLCDWKAATLRHEDGDINKSIEYNRKRFDISDQLTKILLNTVKLFRE